MGSYTNRFNAKRDANEPEIVDCLRKHGAKVVRLDTPLDLLISWKGQTHLAEVKVEGGKLSKGQAAFIEEWGAPVAVLRSVDDAIEWLKEVESKNAG